MVNSIGTEKSFAIEYSLKLETLHGALRDGSELKVFVILPEHPSSDPRTHLGNFIISGFTAAYNSSSTGSNILSGFFRHPHVHDKLNIDTHSHKF